MLGRRFGIAFYNLEQNQAHPQSRLVFHRVLYSSFARGRSIGVLSTSHRRRADCNVLRTMRGKIRSHHRLFAPALELGRFRKDLYEETHCKREILCNSIVST